MANVRNYEEYRAEVLDTLGATVEDLRNEPSFRAKVLETLGVDFTDEDTRNFERYRLKALEGLKNGSGGGGSSDFSTATVTVVGGDVMSVMPVCTNDPEAPVNYYLTPLRGSQDGSLEEGVYTTVLYKGALVCDCVNIVVGRSISLSGDCEWVNEEDGALLITGDCTITIS